MIAYFRRRRDERTRAVIRTVLVAQLQYEREHEERQTKRLAHVEHEAVAPHGSYDLEQRIRSVTIRARSRIGKPPPNLGELVREVVLESAE